MINSLIDSRPKRQGKQKTRVEVHREEDNRSVVPSYVGSALTCVGHTTTQSALNEMLKNISSELINYFKNSEEKELSLDAQKYFDKMGGSTIQAFLKGMPF